MKFEFITSFSSTVKALVDEEKDKYLALASLVDVGNFVPNVDTEANIDLLPVAFNACVVNRVNRNGDVIDSETAVAMAKNFVNKPINLEHKRDRVVGTILSVGYSEFGTDKQLSEEEVKASKAPFNITLGGVIWKIVNNNLTSMIEEASDPSSDKYEVISASWELGFSKYELVTTATGKRNLEDAIVISDPDEVESVKGHLKALGGSGVIDKTKEVHRKVIGNVLPLGIGLTETPAAEVKGIAVKTDSEKEVNLVDQKEQQEKSEKISQSTTNNVIENNLNRDKTMKIDSLKDINDDNMEQLSASAITDYIQEQLREASEKYAEEKSALEEASKAAAEDHEKLVTEHDVLKTDFEGIKSELDKLVSEKEAKAAEERFTQRMSLFDEKFELNDTDRELIASDIKDLNEESFAEYVEKMKVLMSAKDKEILAAASVEEESEEQVEETEASEDETSSEETQEEVVASEETVNQAEEALDTTVAEESDQVPNAVSTEETLMDKYKTAFSLENGFDVKL